MGCVHRFVGFRDALRSRKLPVAMVSQTTLGRAQVQSAEVARWTERLLINAKTQGGSMESLAESLWRCRLEGTVIQIPADGGPKTVEEALTVQREAVAVSGMDSVGFKVGSTSKEAQRILGTCEPGAGPVLSSYYYQSPTEISVAASHRPAVEGEFAVRLAHDLPPRDSPYSFDEVRGAIGAVAGAIEVVGSRFHGGLAGKGRCLTTADFSANIALAVGEWTENWKSLDLASHQVRLFLDGRLREEGCGARALGHPLNVLQWLANKQSGAGTGLKTGDIVSTGTCTSLVDVAAGDLVVADFASLGKVEVRFADMAPAQEQLY